VKVAQTEANNERTETKDEEYLKKQCDCEKVLRGNFGSIHT